MAEKISKKATTMINAAAAAIFCVLSMAVLIGGYGLYMQKVEALNLFIPGTAFFSDCLSKPGGLLVWCGCFLTQTLCHSWLGAAVYTLLLLLTAWLTARTFSLSPGCVPMAFVIPSMLLLAFISYGYAIYSLKAPGFAFTPVLGTAVALAIYLLWQGLGKVAALAVTVATALVGYPLLGFYALVAAGLQAVAAMCDTFTSSSRSRLLSAATCIGGAALAVVVPKLWCAALPHVAMSVAYVAPRPQLVAGEEHLLYPAFVSGVFLLFATILRRLKPVPRPVTLPVMALVGVVYGVALASVVCSGYDDSNFSLTLRLDKCLRENRWQDAVDEYCRFDDEATRANALMAQVAMIHTGAAPERIFTLPVGNAPYNTARDVRVLHDIAALPVSYYIGMTSFAARWAMENTVEYGVAPETLSYFARIALLNGEYELARKYIDLLGRTLMHKDEARRLGELADDPRKIVSDPELGMLRELRTDDPRMLMDGGTFEPFIWRHLAGITPHSKRQLDLALVAALMAQRLDRFAELLTGYPAKDKPLPRHYQEGILFYGALYGNEDYSAYRFTTDIVERHNAFMNIFNRYGSKDSDGLIYNTGPAFSDTYWFYFITRPRLSLI